MSAVTVLMLWLLPMAVEPTVPPVPAKVRLEVSAHDELRLPMQQYLAAELQSRGIARVVESNAEWTIKIITVRLEDANNVTVAVGLSFVIEQHDIHMKMLLALAQACRYFIASGRLHDAPLEQNMKMLLKGVEVIPKPESLSVVSQHRMCIVAPDQLPQVCNDIIATFNNERLRAQGQSAPAPTAKAGAPTGPAPERR